MPKAARRVGISTVAAASRGPSNQKGSCRQVPLIVTTSGAHAFWKRSPKNIVDGRLQDLNSASLKKIRLGIFEILFSFKSFCRVFSKPAGSKFPGSKLKTLPSPKIKLTVGLT